MNPISERVPTESQYFRVIERTATSPNARIEFLYSGDEFGLPSRDRCQPLCPNLREMTCILRTVARRWPECTPEAGDYRETEVELRSGALALTALFRIRLTGAAA